jgi:hypothetical protein
MAPMTAETLMEILRSRLDPNALVRVRRPGSLFQVNLPAFHADGDAVSVFVRPLADGRILVTDLGMTFMRMSYGAKLTDAIESEVAKVAKLNGFELREGRIQARVVARDLMPAIFGLIQTEILAEPIAKESKRRERVARDFRKEVIEFVMSTFGEERTTVGFRDPARDPEGYAAVDVVVRGPRTLAIVAVSSPTAANDALGTKLLTGPSLPNSRWIAVTSDFNALPNRSRARLLREYIVPANSLAADGDAVRARLLDQAA